MRNFSARETEWLQELDGIELASFKQRALALTIDGIILSAIFTLLAAIGVSIFAAVQAYRGHPIMHKVTTDNAHIAFHFGTTEQLEKDSNNDGLKIVNDVVVPILYFGILLWKGKGQTPGKRIMKIRVVSLMHRHITFWHSVERALGYGAAALEGGFGFVQFFIHPYRRCAQDRLAETIVVTERSYKKFQHKISHPLLPDTAANAHAPE